jgi:hypothetical protein
MRRRREAPEQANQANNGSDPQGFDPVELQIEHESLILAQNERWRRA